MSGIFWEKGGVKKRPFILYFFRVLFLMFRSFQEAVWKKNGNFCLKNQKFGFNHVKFELRVYARVLKIGND
jgi:hypothetical protein